jgi:flagellar motor protein MotB
MAEPEHHEIFIIKRHSSHEEEHRGGAWKIAFADFMTAMMALFLVLWLISSTSDKTKHTVAQYFNPVKLVDMTTLKKGFRDPKETEMGSGPNFEPAQPLGENKGRCKLSSRLKNSRTDRSRTLPGSLCGSRGISGKCAC